MRGDDLTPCPPRARPDGKRRAMTVTRTRALLDLEVAVMRPRTVVLIVIGLLIVLGAVADAIYLAHYHGPYIHGPGY